MYFKIKFLKIEMEKLNLKDQDIFEKFTLVLELQMTQFDFIDKILSKTKKLFKEVNNVTDQGVTVIKLLCWCYNNVGKLKFIYIIFIYIIICISCRSKKIIHYNK